MMNRKNTIMILGNGNLLFLLLFLFLSIESYSGRREYADTIPPKSTSRIAYDEANNIGIITAGNKPVDGGNFL